jgi:hypothetical protein
VQKRENLDDFCAARSETSRRYRGLLFHRRSQTERGEMLATLHGELRTILEWTERQDTEKADKKDKTRRWYGGFVGLIGCGGWLQPLS